MELTIAEVVGVALTAAGLVVIVSILVFRMVNKLADEYEDAFRELARAEERRHPDNRSIIT